MSKKQNKKVAPQSTTNLNWVIGGVALIVIVLVGVGFVFTQQTPAATGAMPLAMSVAEAYAKREAGAFILDVRTPEEWREFHVPNSTLIPVDELAKRVAEVPQDKPIVVVCRSGNRSQTGRDILLKAGYKNVTSMNGGLNEWRAAGYPTITGP